MENNKFIENLKKYIKNNYRPIPTSTSISDIEDKYIKIGYNKGLSEILNIISNMEKENKI